MSNKYVCRRKLQAFILEGSFWLLPNYWFFPVSLKSFAKILVPTFSTYLPYKFRKNVQVPTLNLKWNNFYSGIFSHWRVKIPSLWSTKQSKPSQSFWFKYTLLDMPEYVNQPLSNQVFIHSLHQQNFTSIHYYIVPHIFPSSTNFFKILQLQIAFSLKATKSDYFFAKWLFLTHGITKESMKMIFI